MTTEMQGLKKRPGPKPDPTRKLVSERQAHEVWEDGNFYFFILKRYQHADACIASIRPIGDLSRKNGEAGKCSYGGIRMGARLLTFNPLVEYDKGKVLE